MLTGLKISNPYWTFQNADSNLPNYLSFHEYGLENNSDNSSELFLILPYTEQMNREVRLRRLVNSKVTITPLGSMTRRGTNRTVSRVEIQGATIRLYMGSSAIADKLDMEVLNE